MKQGRFPVEEIVVTGTRIRGASPAAPVFTIDRADIEQSGYSQTGELLRSLPQNFPGGHSPYQQPTPNGGGNATNASSVNLRGLGPDATLVLFNGQRVAGDGLNGAPDVSAIPLAAIERVEVATDGASALYGSDAVAGVVNFVLRDDFDGAELSGRLGRATQGGGFEQTYNAVAGRASRTGHLMGGVEVFDQEEILADQRDFTMDAGPLNTLQPPQDRLSLFTTAHQDLGSRVTVRFDGLYTERSADLTTETAPGAFAAFIATETNAYLLAPTLDVALGGDWKLSLSGTLGRSENFRDATFNVGGGFQDKFRNESTSLELNADGTLITLPTGDLRVAMGGGRRQESWLNREPGDPDQFGDRQIEYVFGELQVPLVRPSDTRIGLHGLEFSLAARYEDYSDFGDRTSPRIGVVYQPLDGLRVRATWGESFKAAPFSRITAPHNLTLRDATTLGSTVPGTALTASGGNANLAPETSTSWTAGFDWSQDRVDGFQVSATYFNVDYRNRIVLPFSSIATMLSDPSSEPFIIRNPSIDVQSAAIANANSFANITSEPYDPASVIALVQATYTNAQQQTIDGVDVSATRTFGLEPGLLDVHLTASWQDLKQRNLPTLPLVELSGRAFHPAETRMRGGVTWSTDNLTASAFVNYQKGGVDWIVSPPADIDSRTTLDINIAYRLVGWTKDLESPELSLAVINALDEDPPFVAGAALGGLVGMTFDSMNASPIGRFVAVTVRQRF